MLEIFIRESKHSRVEVAWAPGAPAMCVVTRPMHYENPDEIECCMINENPTMPAWADEMLALSDAVYWDILGIGRN